MDENVNWLSMVLAILTPTRVGFIYYHKAVFGKAWMDSIGMTGEKAKKAILAPSNMVPGTGSSLRS